MSIIYNNKTVAGKYKEQIVNEADTVNAGIVKIATQEQIEQGLDNTTAVTPLYLSEKQDKLVAGDGIVIDENLIECTVYPDEQTIVQNDNGTIVSVGQMTKAGTIKFDWEGTEAEYTEAMKNGLIQPDWYCYITDDEVFTDYGDVVNQSLSNLKDKGEEKLNVSKMYYTGDVYTEEMGYNQLLDYKKNIISEGIDEYNINGEIISIPYVVTKTGEKISDAQYRESIKKVYDDRGVAGYFTLDEENKNYTMPMGSLYGVLANIYDNRASLDMNNLTAVGKENLKEIVGSDLDLFDTKIVDHILDEDESMGWGLQGTYVYRDAVVGKHLGYPTFYDRCIKEMKESSVTSLNGTIKGTLTNNNGVISGFSSANSLIMDKYPTGIKSFDIVFKYTTPSEFTVNNVIYGQSSSTNYATIQHQIGSTTKNAWWGISQDGSTWTSINSGNDTINTNTTYYSKLSWDGGTAKAYLSTTPEFTEDNLIGSVVVTSVNWVERLCIGVDQFGSGTSTAVAEGKIDLKESYININGERWWDGIKQYRHSNKHEYYPIGAKDTYDSQYNSYGFTIAYGVDEVNKRIFLPRNTIQIHGRLIESYSSGTSWYRIYSDGWCEQGGKTGVLTSNVVSIITFLKQFKNTNYTFTACERYDGGTSDSNNENYWVSTLTAKNISIYNSAGGYKQLYWTACGYISYATYLDSENYKYLYYCVGTIQAKTSWIKLTEQVLNGVKEIDDARVNALNDIETEKDFSLDEIDDLRDVSISEIDDLRKSSISEIDTLRQNSVSEVDATRITSLQQVNTLGKDTLNELSDIKNTTITQANDILENGVVKINNASSILTNTQVTSCVLEEPNNIKLELQNANYDIVGELSYDGNGIKGFSTGNYAVLKSVPSNITSYEIVTKVKLGSLENNHQGIFANSTNLTSPQLIVYGSQFRFQNTSNGTSWDPFIETTLTLAENDIYYLRCKWENNTVSLEYKKDGDLSYILVGTVSDITKCNWTKAMCIGIDTDLPFNGTIYPEESYININGERWWTGQNQKLTLKKGSQICVPYGTSYNVGKVDSVTINNNGVASGFTANNYLNVSKKITDVSNWEFGFKVKFSDVTTTQHSISIGPSGSYTALFSIASGLFRIWVSSDNTTWDVANNVAGTYSVQVNTEYYIRYGYNGKEYYLEYSLNGEDYVRDITVTSTSVISKPTGFPNIGKGWGSSPATSMTIDLKYSYIKVKNNNIWTGEERTLPSVGDTFINNNFKVVHAIKHGSQYMNIYVETQNDIDCYSFATDTNNRCAGVNIYTNSLQLYGLQQSGTDGFSGTSNCWYYHTDKNIVDDIRLGVAKGEYNTLPIAHIKADGTHLCGYINQTFDSFGYIGKLKFLNRGTKVLFSNGRNTDGTLNNTEYTTTWLYWSSGATSTNKIYNTFLNLATKSFYMSQEVNTFIVDKRSDLNVADSTYAIGYVVEENMYYLHSSNQTKWVPFNGVQVCRFTNDSSGNVSSVKPYKPFRAVDYNDFKHTINTLESSVNTLESSVNNWVKCQKSLSTATALGSYTIDLSTTLPNDGHMYEVLLSYIGYCASESYTQGRIYITNEYFTSPGSDNGGVFGYMTSGTDKYQEDGTATGILPIGLKRNFTVTLTGVAKTSFRLYMYAYRKLGKI